MLVRFPIPDRVAGDAKSRGHGHTVKAETFPAFPERLFRSVRRSGGKVTTRAETVKKGGFNKFRVEPTVERIILGMVSLVDIVVFE